MKTRQALWLAAALFAVATTPSAAIDLLSPNGKMATGLIVDANNQPVPGVPVEIVRPSGKTTAFTDALGFWNLYNLAPGTYHVRPLVAPDTAAASFTIDPGSTFQGPDQQITAPTATIR